jgi:succinate-semialdehyde dehydrogenase/glutarate-semialdehyde dehydrogenase
MNLSESPLLQAQDPRALQDTALLHTRSYVSGQRVAGEAVWAVKDPASAEVLALVESAGPALAQAALDAAQAAWPAWRERTALERCRLLKAWHALMLAHAEDLARIMTAEQGKPLSEARAEVAYGASFVDWFAEEGRRVYGETIPSTDGAKRLLVLRQAIGVCAAITPWNFPLAMITRKVAPALAAGCPVVIKPSEATPLTALALAELANRAGFPPGVLNVVVADAQRSAEVGRVWCASPLVRHLSFTGSTEVGRLLAAQCAPTVKKLSLELGGNAPFIVFDDADLDAAVEGAWQSKYRNAGQTCVCSNRLLVQAGVYEAFVDKLAARVALLQVGPGTQPGVQVGPLIDEQALHKVQAHLEDALALGARVCVGGKALGGLFFQPTVLADATPAMRCAREETFGPLAPVFRFETEQEAIAMANDTEFGLASYFYSRDIGRVFRVAEALEAGMVGVNTGLISTAEAPFGGVKQSGLGREGSHHGMDDYLEIKYLCLGGLNS